MKNNIALITGGTKGIGKALVELFASKGFDVITCSRNAEELVALEQEIKTKHNTKVYHRATDLSKKEEVFSFIDYVIQLDKAIDVLINNAGIFSPSALLEEEDDNFELQMNVNLNAVYYITKKLMPFVIKAPKAHIFNMCSIAGQVILRNCGSYTISKFAIIGMTKVLRQELLSKNIKVTAIIPGATMSASWDGSGVDPERIMEATEIAQSIWDCFSLKGNTVVEEIVIRPQLGDL